MRKILIKSLLALALMSTFLTVSFAHAQLKEKLELTKKKLNDLKDKLGALKGTLVKLKMQLKSNVVEEVKESDAVKDLKLKYEESQKEIKSLQEELERLKSAEGERSTEIEEYKKRIENANKEAEENKKLLEKALSDETTKQLKKQIEDLKRQLAEKRSASADSSSDESSGTSTPQATKKGAPPKRGPGAKKVPQKKVKIGIAQAKEAAQKALEELSEITENATPQEKANIMAKSVKQLYGVEKESDAMAKDITSALVASIGADRTVLAKALQEALPTLYADKAAAAQKVVTDVINSAQKMAKDSALNSAQQIIALEEKTPEEKFAKAVQKATEILSKSGLFKANPGQISQDVKTTLEGIIDILPIDNEGELFKAIKSIDTSVSERDVKTFAKELAAKATIAKEGSSQDVQDAIQKGLDKVADSAGDNIFKVLLAAEAAADYGKNKGFDEAKQARIAVRAAVQQADLLGISGEERDRVIGQALTNVINKSTIVDSTQAPKLDFKTRSDLWSDILTNIAKIDYKGVAIMKREAGPQKIEYEKLTEEREKKKQEVELIKKKVSEILKREFAKTKKLDNVRIKEIAKEQLQNAVDRGRITADELKVLIDNLFQEENNISLKNIAIAVAKNTLNTFEKKRFNNNDFDQVIKGAQDAAKKAGASDDLLAQIKKEVVPAAQQEMVFDEAKPQVIELFKKGKANDAVQTVKQVAASHNLSDNTLIDQVAQNVVLAVQKELAPGIAYEAILKALRISSATDEAVTMAKKALQGIGVSDELADQTAKNQLKNAQRTIAKELIEAKDENARKAFINAKREGKAEEEAQAIAEKVFVSEGDDKDKAGRRARALVNALKTRIQKAVDEKFKEVSDTRLPRLYRENKFDAVLQAAFDAGATESEAEALTSKKFQ